MVAGQCKGHCPAEDQSCQRKENPVFRSTEPVQSERMHILSSDQATECHRETYLFCFRQGEPLFLPFRATST